MYKRKIRDYVVDAVLYILLGIFAFLCLYPFYYIFIYSISNPELTAKTTITFLPAGFSLATYARLLSKSNIFHAAFISVARTVLGTGLTVFCSALFGYLVTKDKLRFRRFFYRAVVITMYLNAGLIPTYILYKKLHLINSFLVYILPGAVSGYYVILIKTYIESLPASLEEAAMLDGASHMRSFLSVILPLCKPILATVAVFCAVGQWNAWQDNFFYVSSGDLRVLQLELWEMLNSAKALAQAAQSGGNIGGLMAQAQQLTPTSVRMTITMITTLPIICVYPFLQRYFTKGMLIGAVKG